ncbi:partial Peptidoglycan-binding protein ArfA, partial [Gammaproteobacteria bacterium]
RPSPGGRGRATPVEDPLNQPRPGPSPSPASAPPPGVALPDLEAGRQSVFADNPVTAAALSLLSLVSRLHNSTTHRDIEGLQRQLFGEIRAFENKILQHGTPQDLTRMASYALCSLLDETILGTPWGWQSNWGQKSLLSSIHKETLGGEKFFPIIEHLRQHPAQNLNLIELCYLCLSLGFQGKYRNMPDGLNALEQYRADLFKLIQWQRGNYERALSPRWQGLKDVRNALIRFVPLWVVAAVAAAILFLAYMGFLFSINRVSDQTLAQLAALGREKINTAAVLPQPVVKPPVPGRVERFKRLLADEIGKDMVEVIDDRTLRIRNSFPSGSDQVKPEFTDMLRKIAQELGAGRDTVLVTGHTDNIPIRSARFPSNWDLSNARAKNVADFLSASGALDGRLRSKGSADGEPLAPNDTPEHRALNRRVDILIQ